MRRASLSCAVSAVAGFAGVVGAQCDPVFLGGYPIPLASNVHIEGSTAYVTAGPSGFYLINVADPTNPTLIGMVAPMSQARNVDVQGDLALLAGGDRIEVECIDISNPSSPTHIGMLSPPDTHWVGNDVEIMGDLAYVAERNYSGGSNAVRVLDLTNPTAPVAINTVATPGSPQGLLREGTTLYVADGGSAFRSGLLIYSLAVPESPALLGRFNTSDLAIDVAVEGDLAFVSDYEHGLDIIDISDPASMSLTGHLHYNYRCGGLDVSRGIVYITNSTYGLLVVDATDPANPTQIQRIDLSDSPLDVEVVGDTLYVAWRSLGLRIYDISSCGSAGPCNDADLGEPYGLLDLADVTAFTGAFLAGDQAADLVEPIGLLDLADVLAFVTAFTDGCP